MLADFIPKGMLLGVIGEAFDNLPDHYKILSEIELVEQVNPTPVDYALRGRITDLVLAAKESGQKHVQQSQIYKGLIQAAGFYYIATNPAKVAFITRQVVTHQVYYQAIHSVAMKKVWQFLASHPADQKTISAILKIASMSADRSIGAVAQRIEQKQHVLHSKDNSGGEIDITPDDPVLIKAKIQELTDRMNQGKAIEAKASAVIDVE